MFQSCACRVRPEGHPGSPVGGDLRKRIDKNEDVWGVRDERTAGANLGRTALPRRGPFKPARTIPKNPDRGVVFPNKTRTVRQPVAEIDVRNRAQAYMDS